MPPTKEKSLVLLRKSLERVTDLEKLIDYSHEHENWERSTGNAIAFVFGADSQYLKDFESALRPYSRESEAYPTSKADRFKEASKKVKALLQLMIEEIEDYWELVSDDEIDRSKEGASKGQDIFIIHGHDSGAKEELARFLSKAGLNPIILHEQASQGKTIIEKFEKYASVSYAIALLTPDDLGASKTEQERLRPRPRQNVLFEFGYFIGKLGRERVCGLVKGEDLEIPSDYSGVVFIQLDPSRGWRLELLKELRAAGFQIDMNAIL
jgi:predicted nucleotide-binding protein